MTISGADLPYTLREERIHTISHGIGAILSVLGLLWMLDIAAGSGDPWRIVASAIFGFSLIALFLASTLYHGLHASRHRHLFKLFDHCAIYLLIAGTYTPFLLIGERTSLGWWLFGAIWSLAVIGVATKIWLRHRFPWWSLSGYLLMGWLAVIAAPQIAASAGPGGIGWLIAGGVAYTVGALIYMAKRVPYTHAIWHVFVLAGAACHFIAVTWFVLLG